MIPGLPEEAAAVYRRAEKLPLVDARPDATVLDRAAIEAILPHRDPLLLVDRVTSVELDVPRIVARYDLRRAADVLAGHFPRRPMYPGVLQAEAIGQAGLLLAALSTSDYEAPEHYSMTHVRAARFVAEVKPGSDLELVAQIFDDGMFMIVVGQTLQNGVVCGAMAASVLRA